MTTYTHTTADAAEQARELLGPVWSRVRRIPLIRREIRESLSDNALELLFCSAELLVEGDRDLEAGCLASIERAYATVMVTLDLAHSATLLRERPDEATAERVAELMRGSTLVRRRLVELARHKLAKLVDAPARSLRIELLPVVRVAGTRILVDGDAVVSLASSGPARRQAGGEEVRG